MNQLSRKANLPQQVGIMRLLLLFSLSIRHFLWSFAMSADQLLSVEIQLSLMNSV